MGGAWYGSCPSETLRHLQWKALVSTGPEGTGKVRTVTERKNSHPSGSTTSQWRGMSEARKGVIGSDRESTGLGWPGQAKGTVAPSDRGLHLYNFGSGIGVARQGVPRSATRAEIRGSKRIVRVRTGESRHGMEWTRPYSLARHSIQAQYKQQCCESFCRPREFRRNQGSRPTPRFGSVPP